jgi:hypothetical protein
MPIQRRLFSWVLLNVKKESRTASCGIQLMLLRAANLALQGRVQARTRNAAAYGAAGRTM